MFYVNGGEIPANITFDTDLGWVHLSLVYENPSTRKFFIYVNGVRVGTATSKTKPITDTDGFLNLGRHLTVPNDYRTSATVDELMFYNRALSDEEINTIYDSYGMINNFVSLLGDTSSGY